MIITKKTLSRRTVLRGMGACIALPVLDAMTPALGRAPARGKAPVRSLFIYAPNGMVMADWTPAAAGAGYEMTPILKAFEPYRNDMIVLTGLMDHNGNALGDGGGDHARAGGKLPHRHSSGEDGGQRHQSRHLGRSGRRERHRIGHAAALARAGLRGLAHGRQLRFRLQLRLHQQPLVARAVDAEPAGNESARGVRAAVRRRRHHAAAGSAREAAGRPQEHPRFGSGSGARDSRHRRRRRPAQDGRVSDRRPRNRDRRFRRPKRKASSS